MDHVDNSIKTLIVEDDDLQAKHLSHKLKELGYQVTGIFTDAESAINSIPLNKPDVVIMDIVIDGNIDGIEAAASIQREHSIPVIIQSSHFDKDKLDRIIENEIVSYLLKPVKDKELQASIEIAVSSKYKAEEYKQSIENKYISQLENLAQSNVRSMLIIDGIQRQREAENELHQTGNYKKFYENVLYDIILLTNSKYGALGIFDNDGNLNEFITMGMTKSQIDNISHRPIGKGLLESIYHSNQVINVSNISQHKDSCGFPDGHPPMTTLLGAPVTVNDVNRGVLYLSEKSQNNQYTFDDEALIRIFSSELSHVIERYDLLTSLNLNQKKLQKEKEEQQDLIKKLQDAQQQLLQSEKMASIGQLAAGVAHEINNPVGYINSNIGTLRGYIDDIMNLLTLYEGSESFINDQSSLENIIKYKNKLDIDYLKDDIKDLIKESTEGVLRVKQIVQNLKDFSHVDEAEWQWADLHKGIDSTLNIVHNEIKYKAEIIKEYGDIPDIECIASQLNQVFMNLFVNAAHAIEGRGEIKIKTVMRDDDFVTIQISDTGKGIPEDKLNRIFDPFFTTKPVGKGTGLGLSLSYSIIQKHNGNIEVESQIGAGTTFIISLPVQQEKQMTENITNTTSE